MSTIGVGASRGKLAEMFSNLKYRNEIAALALMFTVVPFFRPKVPGGIYALAVVSAAGLILHAIGVILIFRINKFINFAQVQLGALGAAFYTGLVNGKLLLRGLGLVCPPCVEPRPSQTLEIINFSIAMIVGMAVSIGTSYLAYQLIVRRFANAPRLLLTISTIFLAQFLSQLPDRVNPYFFPQSQREQGGQAAGQAAAPPFEFSINIDSAPFRTGDILTVVLAVVAVFLIGVYLRKSTTGTAIRAAAESPERAATLGVDTFAVTGRIWMIAGVLSGAAAILQSFTSGAGGGESSVPGLLQILTVGVIARFVSLPMAALAAVVLASLQHGMLWSFGTTAYLDGMLVLLIGGLLLLQRVKVSRAEREGGQTWRGTRELRPIPDELRSLGVVRRWVRNAIILVTLSLLSLPWLLSPSQTNLAGVFVIYYLVGVSLLMLTGWAGQISLGQFAFAAIGAWVVAVTQLPFFLSLILGGIAGAFVAVVIGLPALKLRGLHLAVSTLALSLSVSAVFVGDRFLGKLLPASIERPSIFGMNLDDQRTMYYFLLVIAFGITMAVQGIRRSRTGRALIAARDNEAATQSFGINLVRIRLTAFAMSGFVAAFAGGLFAYHQNGVDAASFAPFQSLIIFSYAVIGGLGGVSGPALGFAFWALIALSPVQELALLTAGAGGLMLLFIAPGGLTLVMQDIRDTLLRRVAVRYRIVVPTLIEDVLTSTRRAPMTEKIRPGGGQVFVPTRYEPPKQWALAHFGQVTDEEMEWIRRSEVVTVAGLQAQAAEKLASALNKAEESSG